MDLERLYLDYNATSPLSKSVLDWLKSGDFLFANPASQHTFGKSARKSINEARRSIYRTFSIDEKKSNLFFHSGASEGLSSFAYSFSEWARLEGKELLICFSKLDHPCVTGLAERYFGSHVKFFELSVGQDLKYSHQKNFEALKDKKDNNPDLMILYHHLWVHNETGIVSPPEELALFKSISDLYIHIDAVQVPGKILNWNQLPLGDIFTFSAHKFGALKGIGFSFFDKKLVFHPFITGGGQQQGHRSGTENSMGAWSIKLALDDLLQIDISTNIKLKEEIEMHIQKGISGLGGVIAPLNSNRNCNTIYFYFDGLSSDIALALFDLNGLMISAGSACSSGTAKASTILKHLGFKESAKNGLRISLPFNLSAEQVSVIKTKLSLIFSKISNQ